MRGLAIVLSWWFAEAAGASPIVIVETRDAPALPSLAQQIVLHANAEVVVQAAPDAEPLTFAGRASELVASGEAELVVWIARVEDAYLVFVAGPQTNRALTELVRVPQTIGTAELERTIALKIAGLLDVAATALQTAPPRPAPSPRPAPPPPSVTTRAAWRIEIDGAIAYEAHERGADGRAALALARAWRWGPWSLAPAVGGYWQPSGTIEQAAGRASIVELAGVAMIEGARDVGPVELFVRPRFDAAVLTVRGASQDGRSGHTTLFAPYVGLEAGVWRGVSNVRFGLVAGCDVALIHRHLVVDDATIVDLGRARVHVGLAIMVSP